MISQLSVVYLFGYVKQILKAKCFQELLFNGVFGKLFIRAKSEKGRKFLLQTDQSLWNPSIMYMLLPLESQDNPGHKAWGIDWKGINSCVTEVEFLKRNARLSAERFGFNVGSSSHQMTDSLETDLVHLANKSIPVTNIRQMVVLAIHTGKLYSVLDIQLDTSAETAFDGNSDEAPSIFSSFADYFLKKWVILILNFVFVWLHIQFLLGINT